MAHQMQLFVVLVMKQSFPVSKKSSNKSNTDSPREVFSFHTCHPQVSRNHWNDGKSQIHKICELVDSWKNAFTSFLFLSPTVTSETFCSLLSLYQQDTVAKRHCASLCISLAQARKNRYMEILSRASHNQKGK